MSNATRQTPVSAKIRKKAIEKSLAARLDFTLLARYPKSWGKVSFSLLSYGELS